MTRQISAENIDPAIKPLLSALASDIASASTTAAVVTDLTALFDNCRTQTLTSAGLRIKGGSASAITQAHTAIYAVCAGVLVTKAADTDMVALSGTVLTTLFNVFCHFIDSAGTLTTTMGTAGATLAAVVWPTFTAGKACIGVTIVNPTGTGSFVGGTTVLDDATVVPNAVFLNTQGAFDPKTVVTATYTAATATIVA